MTNESNETVRYGKKWSPGEKCIMDLEHLVCEVAEHLGRSKAYSTRYSPSSSYVYNYGFATNEHHYIIKYDSSDDEEVGGYTIEIHEDTKLAYYKTSYDQSYKPPFDRKEGMWDKGNGTVLVPKDFVKAITEKYNHAK